MIPLCAHRVPACLACTCPSHAPPACQPTCLPACLPAPAWPRPACPQSRIAVVNTVLTSLGMWALAIPGVGLLSLFVFCCGFIPIAGVIISTVPIGFVALTEYGFTKVCASMRGGGGAGSVWFVRVFL